MPAGLFLKNVGIGLWHWVNPGHFQTNQVPYILLIHPNIYDIPLYPRKHIPFTYTPRNIQFISHSTSHLPREISNSMTYPIKYWLVVWNICYFSRHIGNVIIPTDFHSIIFQRCRRKTSNQIILYPYMPYYPMINPYGYVCLLLQTSLQDVSSGLEHLLHCAAQQRRLSLARFALRLGAEVRGHMR